jgi:IS30 family transposase
VAKLARCKRLRAKVEAKLAESWLPEEISGWLARTYPKDPEMYVSHETIYQSIFVQGRGALRHELHVCLRSGRAMRRKKRWVKSGHGMGRSATWS